MQDSGIFPFNRVKTSRWPLIGLALALAVLTTLPAGAMPPTARQAVESFHDTLLTVMKDGEALGYRGRFDTLAPVVRETFNMSFMARIATGSGWKKAQEDERRKLVEAFTRMTIANYAARFESFSGESFEIRSVEEAPRDSLLVKTWLIDSDGDKVAFNYMLRQFNGQWRVVDIILKGTYSELATKRSEYASLIRSGGVGKLIDAMDEKTAKIAEKAEAS